MKVLTVICDECGQVSEEADGEMPDLPIGWLEFRLKLPEGAQDGRSQLCSAQCVIQHLAKHLQQQGTG